MSAAESAPSRAARGDGEGARAGRRLRHAAPAGRGRAALAVLARARRDPRGRARPAAVGRRAGPAVRLQRRRERALRPRRDRAVRPRPEPALLRQPARLHVPAARRVRRVVRRPRGRVERVRGPTRPRCSSSRASRPRSSGRSPCGCCTSPAARFFDRRVGLLAAALLAVAFLPVFYSHLALNDVPTLAPIALSLWGTAGVLRRGRLRDYALAGSASAWRARRSTPAGIVLLPLLAAAACSSSRRAGARRRPPAARPRDRVRRPRPRRRPRARRVRRREPVRGPRLRGLPRRAATTRPTAAERRPRQARADPVLRPALLPVDVHLGPRLGAARRRRPRRARHARAGTAAWRSSSCPRRSSTCSSWARRSGSSAAGCCRSSRSSASLAAWAVVRGAEAVTRRAPMLRPALYALGAVLAARPGDRVLAPRRAGPLAARHAQPRPRVARRRTCRRGRRSSSSRSCPTRGPATSAARTRGTSNGARWIKFPTSRSNIANDGSRRPRRGADRQHRGLRAHALPGPRRPLREAGLLLGRQRLDPARAARRSQPKEVPQAIAYYRALEQRADVAFHATPVPRRREAGAVQLRLVVRLLPAGLRAARSGDDDLPAARWQMRARRRSLMAQSAI